MQDFREHPDDSKVSELLREPPKQIFVAVTNDLRMRYYDALKTPLQEANGKERCKMERLRREVERLHSIYVLAGRLDWNEFLTLEGAMTVLREAVQGMRNEEQLVDRIENMALDKLGVMALRNTKLSKENVEMLVRKGVITPKELEQLALCVEIFGINFELQTIETELEKPFSSFEEFVEALDHDFIEDVQRGIMLLKSRDPSIAEKQVGELTLEIIPYLVKSIAEEIGMETSSLFSLMLVLEQVGEDSQKLVKTPNLSIKNRLPPNFSYSQLISLACYVIKKIQVRVERFLDK